MDDEKLAEENEIVREGADGKEYVVRSVFVGKQDLKTVLFELAERKALSEMGIDGT